MLFLDTLNAALSLNIGFFVWLFTANIVWLFMFLMVMTFFQNRKTHRIYHLVVLIIMLYAFTDFMGILRWHIPPIMQFPLIAGNIAIFAFEDYDCIKSHRGVFGLGLFWVLFVIFNTILVI